MKFIAFGGYFSSKINNLVHNIKKNKIFLDGLPIKKKKEFVDHSLAEFFRETRKNSVLYSKKHGIVKNFATFDSGLYFAQAELELKRAGKRLALGGKAIDVVAKRRRIVEKQLVCSRGSDEMYEELKERYLSVHNYIRDLISGGTRGIGFMRMGNLSLITSIIFGMFLMTLVYRYFGPGVQAKEIKGSIGVQQTEQQEMERVLGETITKEDQKQAALQKDEYTAKVLAEAAKNNEQSAFEAKIRSMVKGYPIEQMVPEIAKKDPTVAAFMIGIARKESSWGVHVPVLNGEDCYNYWGYRGQRDRMGTGGHTCFDSAKDAVDTVAKRIDFLVSNKKLDTPDKMVIWKCGSSCAATGGQAAANKWIQDVDYYFQKFDIKKK